jgi:PAS domain S-box-containing protein
VHDIVSVEYADGEPRTLRGFIIDVTDRKRTEEALRDSEGRYQTLAELSPVGIFHTDSHGECLFVNERWCEIAGLSLGQARGSGWVQAVHPDDRERVRQEWYDAARANQPFRSEYRFRRPDGQTSWVVGQATAETENGTVKGYVGTITCITDRKQAEEAVRDLSGRLINAQEEERRRLARELHDDLTQRLAVLAIDAGKMEQQLASSDPLVVSRLRHIKDRVVKLSADIHGLSHQLHPSILDDLGLVNAIEAECANFAEREGIQVRCQAKDLLVAPPGDVALGLYRITQEGLRNIAKHAQTKKAVVSLTGTDGEILLMIRDYGVGFDAVGVRGKKGLGLASMEERVRLMRGDLSIKSQPGQGTTILVRVPLAGGHA